MLHAVLVGSRRSFLEPRDDFIAGFGRVVIYLAHLFTKAQTVVALLLGRYTCIGDGWFHEYFPGKVYTSKLPQIEEAKFGSTRQTWWSDQ